MSNALDCPQCGLKLDLRSDDNFNSDHTAIICPRCGSKECAVSVEVHNLTTHDIQLSPTGEFIIGPEKSAISAEIGAMADSYELADAAERMTMTWLTDEGELERLNEFCRGKQITRIEYDARDDLTLHFTDGSEARMSTLGGVEIEELKAYAQP